jgi:hypothetical protein
MRGTPELKRFIVVTGHYGCGKTNLSINLALDFAAAGEQVTLVDLDIVNPYFRSSDYASLLAARDVRLIAPSFAGTTLDTPSLPAEMYAAFDTATAGRVILDVGGDDAGATALGRFSAEIAALDYDLLYVVNRYRNLTATAAEAVALLPEIEAASHLKATGVVNNSHLQRETAAATVLGSLAFGREVAALLGLPLVATAVPREILGEFSQEAGDAAYVENAYPVDVYVHTPWETGAGADEEGS